MAKIKYNTSKRIIESGNESIIKSFLRGAFEASGSLDNRLKTCDNETFLRSLVRIFEMYTGEKLPELKPPGRAGFHRLLICKKTQMFAILFWLYKDARHFSEEKKTLVDKFMGIE